MQDHEQLAAEHEATVLRRLGYRKGLEHIFGWRSSAYYQRWRGYYRRWRRLLAFATPLWRSLKRDPYATWVQEESRALTTADTYAERIAAFARRPTVSILTVVREPHLPWLEQCLASVVSQWYPHWELWLCNVDPHSSLLPWLEQYRQREPRVKILPLSSSSKEAVGLNRALLSAVGEFIGLLNQHDLLAPHALYEIVRRMQEEVGDVFYSDEDEVDARGARSAPFCKPDWSPDLCLSSLYACQFTVYRRSLVEAVGGVRAEYAEGRAYDVLLRCTERSERIVHIPRVLYHKRREQLPQLHLNARRALQAALNRRGEAAEAEDGPLPCTFQVRRRIMSTPLISIIIPTRDRLALLLRCIESIEARTTYRQYEILIIDNNSQAPQTLAYLASLPHRVLRDNAPFNFARLNNRAAALAKGEHLLFLNNDMEVITPGWVEALLEHAQRKEVGAVGAQLLYPDNTIQHAGVILGVRGVAAHAHKYLPAADAGYQGFPHLIRNYSAVTAACLMTRKAVYEEIGGMEERLAVTFNDVDFCLRLRERGYLIVYTPYARLYHHESQSRWLQPPHDEEVRYMLARWGPLLAQDPYYHPHLTLKREDFRFDLGRARAWSAKESTAS